MAALPKIAHVIRGELMGQAREPADGEVAAMIRQQVASPALADLVAEAVTGVGPDGYVAVEPAVGTEARYAYREGLLMGGNRWSAWPPADGAPVEVVDPVVALVDDVAKDVECLDRILNSGFGRDARLVLVVRSLASGVLEEWCRTRAPGWRVIATSVPLGTGFGSEALADIGAFVGAEPAFRPIETGTRLSPDNVGRARRAKTNADGVYLLGGAGGASSARARAAAVRRQVRGLPFSNPRVKPARQRAAELESRLAVLRVGADTKFERNLLVRQAETAVSLSQLTLADGVIERGDLKLREVAAMDRLTKGADQAVAADVMRDACAVPASLLAEFASRGPGVTDPDAESAGAIDPVGVLVGGVEMATESATQLLTAKGLIRVGHPEVVIEP